MNRIVEPTTIIDVINTVVVKQIIFGKTNTVQVRDHQTILKENKEARYVLSNHRIYSENDAYEVVIDFVEPVFVEAVNVGVKVVLPKNKPVHTGKQEIIYPSTFIIPVYKVEDLTVLNIVSLVIYV